MTDSEKINILLKEYDTLRSEIVSRITSRTTLLGVSAVAAAIIGRDGTTGWAWLAAGSVVVLLLAFWWYSGGLMKRCADRIAELETRINAIAGERLLQWESKYSARTGILQEMYGEPKRDSTKPGDSVGEGRNT